MRFTRPVLFLSALVMPLLASADAPAPQAPVAQAGPMNDTGPASLADFLTSCQTPGQVALTYTEGPSEATMSMLETLRQAQARVTFFANATWLQYMQYAGVCRHAYMDGHLIGMTYRLPSDTSAGLTDDDLKQDIARNSRTIQDLIGVYPRYIKIHESNLKDARLVNLVKSMGYTLVGFNMDEYDYKFNTAATSGQIAEVFNTMFTKQMDAYGRQASYVVAGYDVPATGAASGLPKVINMIQQHGYDMVRLDGCTNDKTPYKKDPILNNGFIGDVKSFGAAEYKHGQNTVNYNPAQTGGGGGGGGGGDNSNKGLQPGAGHDGANKNVQNDDKSKPSSAVQLTAASIFVSLPALVGAYLL